MSKKNSIFVNKKENGALRLHMSKEYFQAVRREET